jgi:hypothetical protein
MSHYWDKEKTGGHAFPTLFIEPEHGSGYAGMTLRDWFAGQALSNMYTHEAEDSTAVARWAYQIADAMLAERSKGVRP